MKFLIRLKKKYQKFRVEEKQNIKKTPKGKSLMERNHQYKTSRHSRIEFTRRGFNAQKSKQGPHFPPSCYPAMMSFTFSLCTPLALVLTP